MSALLPSASFDWLPIVALLCLGSVLFLVFSAHKYFAGRAQNSVVPDAAPNALRTEPPTTLSSSSEFDHPAELTISRLALLAGSASLVRVASTSERFDEHSAEDQRPGTTNEPNLRPVECQAADLGETVCARVSRDRASAHGLIDLVRALYLDESTFTFHVIAQLQPDDRALAQALIERWLADPIAIEYWGPIYARLLEGPDALRPLPSSSFAGVVPHECLVAVKVAALRRLRRSRAIR